MEAAGIGSLALGTAQWVSDLVTNFTLPMIQHKFDTETAELQNQFNVDMWKMQADYNSPQSQMQRFADAGLNPNLIYGQGNNGNMTSAPQKVAAGYDFSGYKNLFRAFNLQQLQMNAFKLMEEKEDLRIKQLERFQAEDQRDAMLRFGRLYSYDLETGRFKFVGDMPGIEGMNPRGEGVGNGLLGGALLNKYLAEHDPRMWLWQKQRDLYTPQIHMRNYDWQNYEKTFWLDKASLNKPLGLGAALWHYINEYVGKRRMPQF